ncbi:MAG: CbrC family protein, partial [Actinobacteria bacterium]|nr:CbrC family protein [Actinomycetota bacterium]
AHVGTTMSEARKPETPRNPQQERQTARYGHDLRHDDAENAPSDGKRCDICSRDVDLVYEGPVYSRRSGRPTICDECIASGRAADELDAMFTDLGGDGWEDVPRAVKDEVLRCTPGFTGWQQETWRAHCGDAMNFLGPVGHRELVGLGPEAVASLRRELTSWGWPADEVDDFISSLDRNDMPTAYAFRCRHCNEFEVYADFT